ncbi:hypothetical protein [Sphingobacterium sp. SYP-B4668]|uniref:hypothetical protein n=1 Tax=Sphingobacterium sp. SYP-B4668 TaxID=2996035 RepID=UPI0022DE3D8B|nr:hypothetical protein [Sphingobacterium sp. SYP-B4668]
MKKITLDSLKESLEIDEASKVGRYGIFIDSSDSRDEKYFIKGNREGLNLFAYQLLCAANDLANQEKENSYERVELHPRESVWIYKHSDIHIEFIESPQLSITENLEPVKETWKDWVGKIGCLVLVGFLIISLIIGIITVFSYLS